MSKSLSEAIRSLPDQYITARMAMAAAREHNFQLLNYLPRKFVTPKFLKVLFSGKAQGYCWDCDLSRIREALRTEDICRKAVKYSRSNIHHVPPRFRTRKMIEGTVLRYDIIKYAYLIPAAMWDIKLIHRAMECMQFCNTGSYRRGLYKGKAVKHAQVLLHYVPQELKDKAFYRGLFDWKIQPEIIDAVTPKKFKDKAYYLEMVKREFDLVPLHKFGYDVAMSALGPDSKSGVRAFYHRHKKSENDVRDVLFSLLDDALADAIVKNDPEYFNMLPERFQTEQRLILAVKTAGEGGSSSYGEYQYPKEMLSLEVVREFIRQGLACHIPPHFWNPGLAAFCLENGTKNFFWLKQMPKKFQTRAIVAAAFANSHRYLKYSVKKYITKAMTTEAIRSINSDWRYRSDHLADLPQSHFREFTAKTGLPERFMGGEVDFLKLKTARVPYTYCRLGDILVGLYDNGDRYDKRFLTIVTKLHRDKDAEVLASGGTGSFHKTWVEKLVADHDPDFIKPVIDPELKDVQSLSYYGVEFVETDENGVDIYRNTFRGVTVGYCAKKDGVTYHDETVYAAVSGWEYKMDCAQHDAGSGADENRMVTAFMLNRRYGFCQTGMSAFTEDYGLDYYGRYSIGDLRRVVAEQGRKPSTYTYKTELKQINVI